MTPHIETDMLLTQNEISATEAMKLETLSLEEGPVESETNIHKRHMLKQTLTVKNYINIKKWKATHSGYATE